MARGPAVILLLSCFALASTNYVKNTKLESGKRDVDQSNQNPYSKQFTTPTTNIELGLLQPPSYMNSLLNQVLDLRGRGHANYLNVYPSSWKTNQVNSELTVDVQFNALVDSQIVRCSAHVSASMPPTNTANPTIVPGGSTVQCSPSSASGGSQSVGSVNTGYGYGNNGYGGPPPPLTPGPYVLQTPLYNPVPHYYVPRAPQVVYRTKYVPVSVPTFVHPAPETDPLAATFLPGGPMRNPSYNIPGGPIRVHPYSGISVNDVVPVMQNYVY